MKEKIFSTRTLVSGLAVTLSLLLASCSADVSKAPLVGNTTVVPIPSDPVITSYIYTASSVTQTVNPPYLVVANTITPDFGTGACASAPTTAQVTFNGTYDNVNGKSFVITGVSSSTTTTSGNTFQVVACLPIGTSTVKFSSLNSGSVANTTPVVVSINIPNPNPGATLTTIGTNQGFQMLSAAASGLIRATASGTPATTLINFSLGDKGQQSINSTGGVGYTFESGYVNMISNASP